MPRTLGVEEEFHVVDLTTRRLTARAPELLDVLSNSYVAELQRCVVEMNSGVVHTLDGLRADLQSHRRVPARLGMGVVAAGAVPLICGTSAARQRMALRRRGRLTDVVDQLLAETADSWPDTAAVMEDPTLLFGDRPDHDETNGFIDRLIAQTER
jgi:gamma-glutamyl:cysteine ligase YbdK (ATP-grasp superfamily)